MEYWKIIFFLDNAPNQPFKFRIENWVEINHDGCERYDTNSQAKFKPPTLKPSLCDYSDPQTHVTIGNMQTSAAPNDRNKKLIFKNFAPFTDCTSEINYRPGDNAKDIDVVMPMYDLITLMQ